MPLLLWLLFWVVFFDTPPVRPWTTWFVLLIVAVVGTLAMAIAERRA